METKRINDIPGLSYCWQVDNLYLAGQPSEVSFDKLKENGFSKVLNMRAKEEIDFTFETAACDRLGIEYVQFPIVKNGELDPEACKRLSEMINTQEKWFIHCGSANRIAGWLMTYLPLYRNVAFDTAVEIAMQNGLSNPGFIEQARAIVEANS